MNRPTIAQLPAAIGLVAWWCASFAPAAVIHVPDDYPTIREAIQAADDGDVIELADGVYQGPDNRDLRREGIGFTIRSASGDPAACVVDAEGAAPCFFFERYGGGDVVIEGITLMGGAAAIGGGAYLSDGSHEMRNCIISACHASTHGGGLSVASGDLLMEDCVVTGCSTDGEGGGMYLVASPGHVIVRRCRVVDNVAARGGGVFCMGHYAALSECDFIANVATISGGGVYGESAEMFVTASVFAENLAVQRGGAVFIHAGSYEQRVSSCLIVANAAGEGGGVFLEECALAISNCTIVDNSATVGGGVSVIGRDAELANVIVWGNTPTQLWPMSGLEIPDASFSIVEGGWSGPGNLDTDPMFIDPQGIDGDPSTWLDNDYALSSSSPGIDAGNSLLRPADRADIDRDGLHYEATELDLALGVRCVDDPDVDDGGFGEPAVIDIGAYEHQVPNCPGDLNADGVRDIADLGILLASYGIDAGGDLDGDGDTDIADLGILLAAFGTECPEETREARLVPAETFTMGDMTDNIGDDSHVRDVTLSPYVAQIHEVTVADYAGYLNEVLSDEIVVFDGVVYAIDDLYNEFAYFDTALAQVDSRIEFTGTSFSFAPEIADHAATHVSWYGAAAYANWLSTVRGYEARYQVGAWTCEFEVHGYRLPTEAEWECIARADEGYAEHFLYPWGDEVTGANANFLASGDPYEVGPTPRTTPVGYYDGAQSPPGVDMRSGHGLYDVGGNVREWCHDWYEYNYYQYGPGEDPVGPIAGVFRVVRGGSWGESADAMQCHRRDHHFPDDRSALTGFRLVFD